MTDAIKGFGKIVETLRRQLAARPPAGSKQTEVGPLPQSAGAGVSRATQLQERTRARVAALDPHDPGFCRKARRAFLQVILSEEFGDDTANAPAFFKLMEELEAAIDGDQSLCKAFDELSRRLGGVTAA